MWQRTLTNQGHSGIAATRDVIVLSDRDAADNVDLFRCLDAATGEPRWTLRYDARGRLDYGQSPRATPLIAGDLVYTFGAFGHLHALSLETGSIVWKKDVLREYQVTAKQVWGYAASPLIVDNQFLFQPGGTRAAITALHPRTGEPIWETTGPPAAFASLIVAELGGKRQLVGYDHDSLGGWDPATGKRLWTLTPQDGDDFNVPTPIAWRGQLIVTTENNGTRLYEFDDQGRIKPEPLAHFEDLAPDSHTPVVVGDRLFAVHHGLYCLDLTNGLRPLWKGKDKAFREYATLIASPDRLLVTTLNGELLLIDALADELKILDRVQLIPDEEGLYSHPALVGNRLYLRGSSEVLCLPLEFPDYPSPK